MDLQHIQDAVAKGVKSIPLLANLPVFSEDVGNIVENVQREIAQTCFCVVVGSAQFTDKTPDSMLCHGTARIVITVFEAPHLNRAKSGRPTYLAAAQAIAKEMKLFDTGEGLLVTKSISAPDDLGGGVVSCDVSFEIETTL